MTWKPIKDAPKDGTKILAIHDNYIPWSKPKIVYYQLKKDRYSDNVNGVWLIAETGKPVKCCGFIETPTHYQDMPDTDEFFKQLNKER